MLSGVTIETMFSLLLAVLMAIIAWWKAQQKNDIVAFYSDPIAVSDKSKAPMPVLLNVPARSWRMSESTLHWITFDATPENKVLIFKQVKDAEEQGLTRYRINYTGGYYDIEYGLQYGGSGNPSGM